MANTDQDRLAQLEELLTEIDATENIELADKVLQLVFSNQTASKNFSANTQPGARDRIGNPPEWWVKQKAEEQERKQLDLVPLVKPEEGQSEPRSRRKRATNDLYKEATDPQLSQKQIDLERDIESKTFEPSDPQARLDESVGEDAYLDKKRLERDIKSKTFEPSGSVGSGKWQPSGARNTDTEQSVPDQKEDPFRTQQPSDKWAEFRNVAVRSATLDMKLAADTVNMTELLEEVNTSAVAVKQLQADFDNAIMSLPSHEMSKYER